MLQPATGYVACRFLVYLSVPQLAPCRTQGLAGSDRATRVARERAQGIFPIIFGSAWRREAFGRRAEPVRHGC